jgi:hydrogenase maturation protein HypF
MLPNTPLHHLLMRDFSFPVIATSGNLSNEPIAIDETEALDRLKEIADLYLTHDRPIACPLDDSVIRVMSERPLTLRHARGYAPLTVNSIKLHQDC